MRFGVFQRVSKSGGRLKIFSFTSRVVVCCVSGIVNFKPRGGSTQRTQIAPCSSHCHPLLSTGALNINLLGAKRRMALPLLRGGLAFVSPLQF